MTQVNLKRLNELLAKAKKGKVKKVPTKKKSLRIPSSGNVS